MTSYTSKASELIIFRNILDDNIIRKLLTLLENRSDTSLIYEYTAEIVNKAEQLGLSGNILNSYINYLITQDENIFSIMTEKTGGKLGNSLIEAVNYDMAILKKLLQIDLSDLIPLELLSKYQPTFATDISGLILLQKQITDAINRDCSPSELSEILLKYYSTYGYGDMANFKAFRWKNDSGLEGIKHFDTITLTDIVGYERQKETLIKNTEAFLNNKPANNVLLIGARGTGKSSSVKALANNYFKQGLRLVEISKQQMCFLPKIMEVLRKRAGKKFILFLDDLSFEEFEVEYKYLKSVIEGGVEAKPDNVLIYATSNRRHLIKETWSDRSGDNDEIHRFDTVHEKISLSDRFGITITYLAPNQDEYLQIVEELARKNNIDIPFSELKQEAIRWELSHSGRSGRTAQQFINYIMGQ
ncbi:ATP-binding protein [Dendrosporobacter sp. 1207_IL3150]|uniref:ATP-binding protein n=1 Tax=Dendrosporobacter sp. 1207_IL3150 TaxID=3084054 RepID=UPI002FDB50A4